MPGVIVGVLEQVTLKKNGAGLVGTGGHASAERKLACKNNGYVPSLRVEPVEMETVLPEVPPIVIEESGVAPPVVVIV